jgi:hypothetical protein
MTLVAILSGCSTGKSVQLPNEPQATCGRIPPSLMQPCDELHPYESSFIEDIIRTHGKNMTVANLCIRKQELLIKTVIEVVECYEDG